MRTFVAIDLPAEIRRSIARLIDLLRPAGIQVRWARAESLHVTLKFIGELSTDRLPEATNRLAAIRVPGALSIQVCGVGYFPHERAPRVIWLGLHSGPELSVLAAQVEEALLPLGIAKEKRPFAPHLTLGRLKVPARLPAVQEILRKQEPLEFGSFAAQEFFLYESQLASGGSVYRKLARFAFVANPSLE
jgi:2'-5' RNA ligase